MTNINLPRSITGLCHGAFEYCSSLTNLSFRIESTFNDIRDYCFSCFSASTSINFPSTIARLGRFAFCNCSFLEEFTIPSVVEIAGERCFSGCPCLNRSTYSGDSLLNESFLEKERCEESELTLSGDF